jgi:hypothetical protein
MKERIERENRRREWREGIGEEMEEEMKEE